MSSRIVRRVLTTTALLAVFVLGSPVAARASVWEAWTASPDLVSRVWDWLASFWASPVRAEEQTEGEKAQDLVPTGATGTAGCAATTGCGEGERSTWVDPNG